MAPIGIPASALGAQDDSRMVFLVGDIEEALIKSTIERIFTLAEADYVKPIYLVISTLGGSVDDTFALYDTMKLCPAPIRTVGLGKIMSAGCLLLAAGQKGERRIGPNARLMYHAGYEVSGGDVLQQEVALAEFRRGEKLYDFLTAAETGQTPEAVEALYLPARIDRYMSAQEAMSFGFADRFTNVV